MQRGSYRFAVEWIALNDNAGDGDESKQISGYLTVALLADLFGVLQERIAKDVLTFRKGISARGGHMRNQSR